LSHDGIDMRGRLHAFHVLVSDSDRYRTWTKYFREAEISSGGQLPGVADWLCNGSKVAPLQ
jgi:hypothetical protein